jgi:hypothetical protein
MPTKVTTAQTPKFDAAKTYSVQVASVVKVGGLTIRPKQGATIRGDLAEQISEQIVSFEPVE